MSHALFGLASWVFGLRAADLPSGLQRRLRLTLLGAAVNQREAAGAARSDPAELAGFVRAWELGDRGVLSRSPGPLAAALLTKMPEGASLADVLVALGAAVEVCLRTTLFLGGGEEAERLGLAAGFAAGAGRFAGLDAGGLAGVIARALLLPPETPVAGAVGRAAGAASAVRWALAALSEPGTPKVEVLEGHGPLATAGRSLHVRAWDGLGQHWWGFTLAHAVGPGNAEFRPAIEGLDEILLRHQRAADKRLRADQIEAIEVTLSSDRWDRGGTGLWRLVEDLPLALAARVLDPDLGPRLPGAGWLEERSERLEALAARVVVRVDPALDQRRRWMEAETLRSVADVAPRRAVARLVVESARALGPLGCVRLLKAEEWRGHQATVGRLWRGSRGPDPLAWREWRPARVVLRTTRGGSWPEVRWLPAGSPGTPGAAVEMVVARRCASPQAQGGVHDISALLESSSENSMRSWLSLLN